MPKCERQGRSSCTGYIGIFINSHEIRWIFIEISFYREKQRGFIRTNEKQMNKLIELGIIDSTRLCIERF
jgi:hypothetical protein